MFVGVKYTSIIINQVSYV